jgi:Protein of unknown function (DUF2924)
MPEPIPTRLSDLRERDRVALSDLWRQLFAASPPTKLRRDLMIPILAYRIQEKTFGSLKAVTRTRLRQLAAGFAKGQDPSQSSKPTLKPGTRLVREWRDEVHLVNVEANGYEYKGGRYKSLSQVARLITGTRWSGPLFFGIKSNRPDGPGKEVQ